MNGRSWWCIGLAVLGLFLFGAASVAQAQPMTAFGVSGSPLQPGQEQTIDIHGSDYINIGLPDLPMEVYYDATKGPWRKTIVNPGAPLTINEVIHVNQGTWWTDWHEEIVSPPGWAWRAGSLTLPIGTVLPGQVSADQQAIWWDFPAALPPCTTFSISKTLLWNGGPVVPQQVTIDEWPTVPEPGTIVMLAGAGLVGLGLFVRRRRGK